MSVWAILIPIAMSTEGAGAAGIAFGIALVPLAFTAAAMGTRQPDWPMSILKAMALSVVVGLPIAVLLRDPLSGLIAAYAAGAVVTVRKETPGTGRRWMAALIVTVIMLALVRVALPLAVTLGPALPFSAILLADRD